MIDLAQHDSDYLNICKYYHAVYNTPAVQAEPTKWQEVGNNSWEPARRLLSFLLYVCMCIWITY
jgi:hypothetical protein